MITQPQDSKQRNDHSWSVINQKATHHSQVLTAILLRRWEVSSVKKRLFPPQSDSVSLSSQPQMMQFKEGFNSIIKSLVYLLFLSRTAYIIHITQPNKAIQCLYIVTLSQHQEDQITVDLYTCELYNIFMPKLYYINHRRNPSTTSNIL